MILGEKIIMLRKKCGWSQEELAEQMGVSRQAVSKWEGSQSVPDLDKLLKLSQIFGVSIDYLVKDEKGLNDVEYTGEVVEDAMPRVSLEDASQFLRDMEKIAKEIALGVSGCVLSPIVLLLLTVLSEAKMIPISEDMAGGIGVAILLLTIIGPIAVFIKDGMWMGKYEMLEKEVFRPEYGVENLAKDKKEKFSSVYSRNIATGVVLCVAGVIPLILSGAFDASDVICVSCVCLLLAMVSLACYLFVSSGMLNSSYDQLLQVGDYAPDQKKNSKKTEAIGGVYWCLVTAIYLGISFSKWNWEISWIIWPCAGVLFGAVACAVNLFQKNK